jgi:hypothetical protein
MPVPSTIDDLSTSAGLNSPLGSESPNILDNVARAHGAFIAQLRDEKAEDADVVKKTGAQTIAGAKTFSDPIVGSLSGNASTATSSTTATNCTRSVLVGGLATGGGALTADRTVTVTASTQAQAEAGTDNATAMTPLRTAQAISKQAVRILSPVQPLQLQVFEVTSTSDSDQPFSFPVAFSTACVGVWINRQAPELQTPFSAINITASGFSIDRADGIDGSWVANILAIGY